MAELILDSVSQSYGNRHIITGRSSAIPKSAIGCLLGPSHHNHANSEQIGIKLAVDHVVAFRHE